MAKHAKIVGNDDGGEDKMIEKSSFSKKPNVSTKYLTFLRSKKRCISHDSFWLWLRISVKDTIWITTSKFCKLVSPEV